MKAQSPKQIKAMKHYRLIAFAAALLGVLMLLLWLSVSAWVPPDFQPKFSALFLAAAFAFELVAIGIMISVTMIKRDLY